MKLRTGATLQSGKYLLTRELGRPSVGATFLATQTLLDQPVVVKALDPSLQLSHNFQKLRDRFIQESRLLACIQHPGIVRVLDFFQEGNLPFLVMEYLPGKSLATIVSEQGGLLEAEALYYVRQIGTALQMAHQNGLQHRNLKPESMIRRQGTNLVTLVGFGFAHELIEPPLQDDLQALAGALYYLLSGRTPTANLMIDSAPWSPTTKQAILQGFTFDAAHRPQSIEEWLRLLPNTTLPLMEEKSYHRLEQELIVLPQPPIPEAVRQPTAPPKPAKTVAKKTVTQQPVAALVGAGRHLPKFLGLTIAAMTAMGLGFGLALRISAAKSPGNSVFHASQTFGEKDWKGTVAPDAGSNDLPTEKAVGDYRSKPAPKVDESGIPKPPKGWGNEVAPVTPVTPDPTEVQPDPGYTAPIVPSVEPRQPEVVPTQPEPEVDPVVPAPVRPRIAPVEPTPIAPVPRRQDPAPEPPEVRPAVPSVREIDPTPPVTSESRTKRP
jgi:eukaryotic-like serine/threonine-protein kinase